MIKNCVIYLVINSVLFIQLLYPIVAYSQNQVTIQTPNNTVDSKIVEPELGGTLPILLPDLGDNSSGNLSDIDEKKLGEKIIREIRKDPDYSNNWLLYDYLNQLGQSLVSSARSQKISGADASSPFAPSFEFFVVKDKTINAFALPGGYIGIHTGLLSLAENESELASVLGHEIGHVTQKHIARGMGFGRESSTLMLAAMLLAALALKSNPNAAQGLAVGGQALAIQNQLSYSRGAEREADRIGFQILQASGFDVSGMPGFFQKMQKATSISDSGIPAYVRTHPLSLERAADMQNRIRDQEPGKSNISLEFYLVQTLAKIEQQGGPSEILDTKQYFQEQTNSKSLIKNMQGYYGLSILAIAEKKSQEASLLLKKSREIAIGIERSNPQLKKSTIFFEITDLQIAMLNGNFNQVSLTTQTLLKTQSNYRSLNVIYIESLLSAGKKKEAMNWLENKTKLDKTDSLWWNYLAKIYEQENKLVLYHATVAEKYVAEGALPAAIQQLKIASEMSNNNFYQSSELEARKRQIEVLYREDLIENGRLERRP
jgi:predicted Zn-dependent protease